MFENKLGYLGRVANHTPMTAVADLLQQPATARFPRAARAADSAYLQLANPKRRALVRAIGLGEVSVRELRARYGVSWGSVQGDLRELVRAGYVVAQGAGAEEVFYLDLGAFPLGMLEHVVDVPPRRAQPRVALRRAA